MYLYSLLAVFSFSIILSPLNSHAEGETNWKVPVGTHPDAVKPKERTEVAKKKKCDVACATVMPKCKSGETAVSVGTSEDCCPSWECRANLDDRVEPTPLDHLCPQAPAIARVCKNNVQPTVTTTTDDSGCSIPKQTCPEDKSSSSAVTTDESTQKAKKKPKTTRGSGNVIQ